MKFLKQGLSLALLGASLTALPVLQATAVGTASAAVGGSLVQQMRGDATGAVQVTRERATGKVGFIRAARGGDLLPSVAGDSTSKAGVKASAYLAKYAPLLGASASQLKQSGVSATKYGWTVTYTQQHRGLPVFGAQLRANLDRAGDLTSVNGYVAPGLEPRHDPPLLRGAGRRARHQHGARDASRRGQGRPLRAAGRQQHPLGVPDGRHPGREGTGDPGLRHRGQQPAEHPRHGLHRRRHRQAGQPLLDDPQRPRPRAPTRRRSTTAGPRTTRTTTPSSWTRSGARATPLPGNLDEDQLNEVEATGDSYWFFRNTFGRDSYDDRGAKMITVNNDPTHRLPQRQLERRHHQLLQRRHRRRHGRPRVGPRLHRVHLRADLPVAVRAR